MIIFIKIYDSHYFHYFQVNKPFSASILLSTSSLDLVHICCTKSSGRPQSVKLFLAKIQGNIGDCGVNMENANVGECDVIIEEKFPSWVMLKREQREWIVLGSKGPPISTDSKSLFSFRTVPWRI